MFEFSNTCGDRWRPWQKQWPWPPSTDLNDLFKIISLPQQNHSNANIRFAWQFSPVFVQIFQSQLLFYISCSPSPLKQRLWWSRSRVTLRPLKGATWQKARRSWGGLFSLSVKEGQKAATLSTYSFYLPETTLPLFCSWETTRQGHVPVQGLSTEHCNERVRVWVFTAGGKQHGMAAQPHVQRKKKLGVICQICRHHVSLCSSTWLSGPLVVPQISSVR